jgi:large subunit ribosomal protein L18
MTSSTKFTVRYRRKREGRTNYKKRLELLKGKTERLVIRRTNTQIIMQIVQYAPDGDRVLLTVTSNELQKLGWKHSCKNTSAAYLSGMLLATKAKSKGIKSAIVDLGLQTPMKGSKMFAAVKGAVDGGLAIKVNEVIFPSEERIKGTHISGYLETHKTLTDDFEKLKKELI